MVKILELFGGIGACTTALKRLNIDYKIVDYVEIDKYAVNSYNSINDTNFEPQDITKWDKNIDVDLIMHGSPCQDFSIAGKQKGGDKGSKTRSSLMYETIKIVLKLKPKYVIWENVKNVLSKKHRHNFDNYINELNKLGYKNYYKVLNAKDFGIPQNRERVFTISVLTNQGFEFPQTKELKIKLKDLLEHTVDEKYYLSDEQINKIKYSTYTQNKRRIQEKDYADCLCARDWKDPKCVQVGDYRYDEGFRIRANGLSPCLTMKIGSPGLSGNALIIKNGTKQGYAEATEGDSVNISFPNSKTRRGRVGKQVSQTLQTNNNIGIIDPQLRIRKLTPKECWRLMGFTDDEFEKASKVNSNTQLYKQAGNSIVVNVLIEILKELLPII